MWMPYTEMSNQRILICKYIFCLREKAKQGFWILISLCNNLGTFFNSSIQKLLNYFMKQSLVLAKI